MAQPAIDIPEPNSDDTDAVATALETAAIFGAQGDAREALRWVRRAAELAGDDGHDVRALNLARVAADLSTQVQSAPPPSSAQVPAAHQSALNETVRISSAPPASVPPQPAPVQSIPQASGATGFAPVATAPRYTPLPTSAAAPPPGYGPQPSPGYGPQPSPGYAPPAAQPMYAQPAPFEQPAPAYGQHAGVADAHRQADGAQYAAATVNDAPAPPPPPPPLPRPARHTQPFPNAALPMAPDAIEIPAAQGASAPAEAPRPMDSSGRRLTPTATPESRRAAYGAPSPTGVQQAGVQQAGVQQAGVNAPPIEPQPALRIEAARVVAPAGGGAEPTANSALRAGLIAEPSTPEDTVAGEPETDPNPKGFSALRQAARVAIMPYPGAAGLYVVQPLEDHQVPAEGTQEAVVILLGSNVNLFGR